MSDIVKVGVVISLGRKTIDMGTGPLDRALLRVAESEGTEFAIVARSTLKTGKPYFFNQFLNGQQFWVQLQPLAGHIDKY